ncbi:MAG: bifunctional precorrin-2 dehydrogenase/sirohydrochlorin ferrochelatase [Chloroflexi bacterium]|nr:bifunctional precorrin-2 dehydrogenase/sirohydrochlorin ferrochelatase [Chloroflexota bacterium]
MKTYPICLIGLEQRQVVVIGGGNVAARKVLGLLSAGACVKVVAPVLAPALCALAAADSIEALEREYRPGDLGDAGLVIAATNDPAVNQRVWAEARQCGCLINVVDDPAHSNFIVPAVVQRGELNIAITTGGASPALARRLRERIEEQIGPEYADLADVLAQTRSVLLARHAPGEPRLTAALHLIDSELLDVIRRDGRDAGKQYALNLLTRSEP